MSRKLLTFTALAVFALPFATAHAQLGFGAAAGLSAPMSDFKNTSDVGYHLTGMVTFSPPLAPIGFRFEGMFNEFNSKLNSAVKTRILAGTANAMVGAPGIIGPYVIGGLGMYRSSASCSACSGSNTNPGFNLGGGLRFGLAGFSAFGEARYHYVKASSGSNLQFIPVSFGVTF